MTTAINTDNERPLEMKLGVIVIPVSDVDRAKHFYGNLGWRLDADFAGSDDYRVIQFTPPGSGASVIFSRHDGGGPRLGQGLALSFGYRGCTSRFCSLAAWRSARRSMHAGDAYSGPDEPYLFGRRLSLASDPERGSYCPAPLVQQSGRQRLAVLW